MGELVRYDTMCLAIAECHRIDEVKDLRDKAMALELYARQARNTDAERKASEVRLRAERRTGELLKELARIEPAEKAAKANAVQGRSSNGTTNVSPYAEALQSTGISRQTAHRYQALANVPQETFEAALREPEKPTTSGLLARVESKRLVEEARDHAPKMPSQSLWLWGRLRDLERDGYFDTDPAALLAPMTESMRADVVRIAPLLADFIERLSEVMHEHA